MSRQVIKDKNLKIIGYIETTSDGKQRAMDAHLRTLGYFDPKQNITKDAHLRIIAHGNVLSGLFFRKG